MHTSLEWNYKNIFTYVPQCSFHQKQRPFYQKGYLGLCKIQKDCILLRKFRVHYTHTHTKITCASEKCQVWPRTTSGPASTVTVRQPSDFNRARGPGDLLAVQAPEPRRRLALWSCNQVLLVMLAWQSYRTGLNLRWPRQDRILLGKRNKAWDKYRKNKNLSHSGD